MIPEEILKTWGAFKFYTILAVAFGVAIYVSFTYGNSHHEKQVAEIEKLKHTMQNLTLENQRLSKQLNILGVELEVQRLAAQKSQVEIQNGLAREAELKEDIQFYQKVMAPELKQDGFVIEAFDIEKSASDRGYRYQLVLMQQDKIKSVIKGNLSVVLVGSSKGKPARYNLTQFQTEDSDPLAFSFKYFQTLGGELVLPEDFIPEQVVVSAEVFQFKRKRGDLEKTFNWQLNTAPQVAE